MQEKKEYNPEERFDGLAEIGPLPRKPQFGRWAHWTQPDLDSLPPVKEYTCYRAETTISIDGRLSDEVWNRVPWSDAFGLISNDTA